MLHVDVSLLTTRGRKQNLISSKPAKTKQKQDGSLGKLSTVVLKKQALRRVVNVMCTKSPLYHYRKPPDFYVLFLCEKKEESLDFKVKISVNS